MSLRVLLLNWRDLQHPEAGGAEKYLVTVAEGLAARGHAVTFRTAAYPGALPEETVAGVRYLRRGGHYSIFPRAFGANAAASHDVVVDVQNGVPYLSPLVARSPVVNLVHHVHREQWPVVFGPRTARFGWWLESQVAPRVYSRTSYVAVSDSTMRELVDLGVDPRAGDDHPQRHRRRGRRRRRALATAAGRRPRPAGAAEAGGDRPRTPWRRCARGCPGCTWTSSGRAGGSPSCARASPPSGSRTT